MNLASSDAPVNSEAQIFTPQRIQLRRTKGWRMPPNTVKVDRTTQWGNPFRIRYRNMALGGRDMKWLVTWCRFGDEEEGGGIYWAGQEAFDHKDSADAYAVGRFVTQLTHSQRLYDAGGRTIATIDEIRQRLRGKNLACWCPIGASCHADILLQIANSND